MNVIKNFLERPEVIALEELQEALFYVRDRKPQDIKEILDKFPFQKPIIEEIFKSQMNKILNIKPILYNQYCKIKNELGYSFDINQPESFEFTRTELYTIIENDDIDSFAKDHFTPESLRNLKKPISTPTGPKPIIEIIIRKSAYNIINYLCQHNYFKKYSYDNNELVYAVKYNNEFLIQMLLLIWGKPNKHTLKAAIKYWNFKFLQWIYTVYKYKLPIEHALDEGYVKHLRFMSKQDTKRVGNTLESLYESMFNIPYQKLMKGTIKKKH